MTPTTDHDDHDDRETVATHTEPDESLAHVLRGTAMDIERGDGDADDRQLTRKVASPGHALLTGVTDHRLLFVVGRDGPADVLSVPFSDVESAAVDDRPGTRRLRVVTGDGTYHVDVDGSPVTAATATAQYVDERATGGATAGSSASAADPIAQIERLAALHERGALTDEEFDRKKAELLDRV